MKILSNSLLMALLLSTSYVSAYECKEPVEGFEDIKCWIIGAIKAVQIEMRANDPLYIDETINIDLDQVDNGLGTWSFDRIYLAQYSDFELGQLEVTVGVVPRDGIHVVVTFPLTWKNIDFDMLMKGPKTIDEVTKLEGCFQDIILTTTLLLSLTNDNNNPYKLTKLFVAPRMNHQNPKMSACTIIVNDVDVIENIESIFEYNNIYNEYISISKANISNGKLDTVLGDVVLEIVKVITCKCINNLQSIGYVLSTSLWKKQESDNVFYWF